MAQFLDTKYPIKSEIEVIVYDIPSLTDEILDSYEHEDETTVEWENYVGIFMPELGHILLAVNSINATLSQAVLAHEYRHVMQYLKDKPRREGPADSFAIHCLIYIQAPDLCE